MNDKRGLYAVVIVAVILLLLLRGKGGNIIVQNSDVPDINITSPNISYELPGLPGPRNDPWDWMQTTDLQCGCDVGMWKEPLFVAPITAPPTNYPVYNYVVTTQFAPSPPAQQYDFPVYTPPPPPTWHWEYGWNVHNEERMYPTTDDGATYIGGKYSRKADAYGQHNQQTKTGTLNGPDLYLYGKHYVHDASKDWARPTSFSDGRKDDDNFIRTGWNGTRAPTGLAFATA